MSKNFSAGKYSTAQGLAAGKPGASAPKKLAKNVRKLVFTSVDDMQSGLYAFTTADDLETLKGARAMAESFEHKTRVKLLDAKIKQLENTLAR